MSNGVKKILILLTFVSIAVVFSGCAKQEELSVMPLELISKKRVVLIIAYQGFQDFEYSETRNVLEKAGADITVASSLKGEAQGKLGKKIEVDKTLEEIKAEDFDALIFIGGPGALEYVDDPLAHQLATQTVNQGKILGAICIAPEILAKAGVLKGRKATVWSSAIDRSPIELLKENGAEYVDQDVVVDKNIITGNGPSAASEFGRKIVDFLNQ